MELLDPPHKFKRKEDYREEKVVILELAISPGSVDSLILDPWSLCFRPGRLLPMLVLWLKISQFLRREFRKLEFNMYYIQKFI